MNTHISSPEKVAEILAKFQPLSDLTQSVAQGTHMLAYTSPSFAISLLFLSTSSLLHKPKIANTLKNVYADTALTRSHMYTQVFCKSMRMKSKSALRMSLVWTKFYRGTRTHSTQTYTPFTLTLSNTCTNICTRTHTYTYLHDIPTCVTHTQIGEAVDRVVQRSEAETGISVSVQPESCIQTNDMSTALLRRSYAY